MTNYSSFGDPDRPAGELSSRLRSEPVRDLAYSLSQRPPDRRDAGIRSRDARTVARASAKSKQLTVARLTLTIAGGTSKTPKLKLTKAAKKLLGAKRKLALKGTVVITDAAGNARTFTVKTTLKAAAKKQRR
jgi:hypothetical protein